MSNQDKSPETPKSNGYEYDCESYAGTDEASIDKLFPGWRGAAKVPTDNQGPSQPAA